MQNACRLSSGPHAAAATACASNAYAYSRSLKTPAL